ncbi:hypothetical protein C8R45DRAFT_1177950 [Mycena sanguinolenta]|nr:hypothetical protein C8R45DRAFT_1177950 [Mycena sanguinolenta]
MDSAQQENRTGESSAVSGSMTRSATPYLHFLATELWLACWTLCSRRQFRRLSLVYELFRDITLPLIFGHQTFEARGGWLREENWIEQLHRLHRAAVRLDALADSTHVGWVPSWKFSARKFQLPSERVIPHIGLITLMHARLLKTFSAKLCLYYNLRSLHLEALVIDAPFRQIFSKLSRLENLALCSCDIVARDAFGMSLRSFTISAQETTVHTANVPHEPLRIMAPDSLHTLHWLFCRPAFGDTQFPHLVILSLEHLSDLKMFLAFLAQCPGLEILKIATVHPDIIASPPQHTLSLETIPALRNLTIRGEMLGFFSLNRPIDSVTILNNPKPLRRHPLPAPVKYFTPTVLNDLLKTSVPLRSLSIPETSPTLELLNSITSLFPQLKDFSIHIKQPTFSARYTSYLPLYPPVDNRCPVLHDAHSFDDSPEDDLSDAEQDTPRSIALVQLPKELKMPSSTDLHKTLQWICSGAALLPHEIEVLRFFCSEDSVVSNFPRAQEHEIIATLSQLYPHFRDLEIGYSHEPWTREGAVWSKSGTNYMQVV